MKAFFMLTNFYKMQREVAYITFPSYTIIKNDFFHPADNLNLTWPNSMKLKLTLLALILSGINAYAQSKNDLSIQYGTTSNSVDIHGAIGDFGYTGKGGTNYGITYTRNFSNSLSLQTGLILADDKAVLSSIQPGMIIYQNVEYKLISVPVLLKYTFFKYLFIDGGLTVDFETNKQSNTLGSSQSGIGYELGFGGKYSFGHFTVFFNPYLQEHAAIPFKSTQQNFNLFDDGYKFGLGYSF